MLGLFCTYDRLRLERFRLRGDLDRIRIRSIGQAQALRFDEVGYFNRVYHCGLETVSVRPFLDEVEEFYRGTTHPIELVPAAGVDLSDSAIELTARGFQPGPRYARLALDLENHTRSIEGPTSGISLRSPMQEDREAVLDIYLRGFGAPEAAFEEARANMHLLFGLEGLEFWIGEVDGVAAGIGMMFTVGADAFLCGGATLPGLRRNGCHRALIQHRIRTAQARGARQVVSWAHSGGESQSNMMDNGLQLAFEDQAWVRPAPPATS